jgi:serine/threonine protein kinase
MPHPIEVDGKTPPFDLFKGIHRLATDRSGHGSGGHARHHLYVARDKRSNGSVLIKLTSRPGRVYEHNLENEIASLSTINRELPDSRVFPLLREHGRLPDGRIYLISSFFDERPLATEIGLERMPARTVSHLLTAITVARALTTLHGLQIFHVDLNPMNILRRMERGRPVIRIVDFESSYEVSRHTAGVFYNPPTSPGYTAPEIPGQAPDARSDVFSLGAVLYTMLAGYQWTWQGDAGPSVQADRGIDRDLQRILLTAVASQPGERYPGMEAFHADLSTYLEAIWPGRSW